MPQPGWTPPSSRSWSAMTSRRSCVTPRPWPSGGTPAATSSRSTGTRARSRRSACPLTAATGARCEPSRAASRRGWFSSRCCVAGTRSCCLTGQMWLEEQLSVTAKTVLLVSHDRELLAACAQRIITVEDGNIWTHGGGFAGYAQARRDRIERLDELRRRWDEKHEQLKELVRMYRLKASYNDAMASRLQAAVTRLRKFEEAGPPDESPREQNVRMRLRGGRTGKRAVICENLELTGLMKPFDLEIWYGERVAVLGSNGSGKSHFLRLLSGDAIAHTGVCKLGARVLPGTFAQTHARPDLAGRTPLEILMTEHALLIGEAMSALARYELQSCAKQRFASLSGGQQARLQILLLELAGSTLLLLDEPTDNLDLASAEALQEGMEGYSGTVVAVTHDRWFARSFDRFVVFGESGDVYESPEPVWDSARVDRPR